MQYSGAVLPITKINSEPLNIVDFVNYVTLQCYEHVNCSEHALQIVTLIDGNYLKKSKLLIK